ncbi:probable GPI ethanolamine phosphate transferase 3 [Rhynchosporium agropyri]|uniref:Probable GPI ethanolamine phosphate transferase 3 n=1 Tax=Rhynchosporium agropyri TaxID=914238 RepID=A0A1E1L630_9HELO|nr:probable GPI ethanolamine phosphate transferase 3 [Rhynchosporium agropyri]
MSTTTPKPPSSPSPQPPRIRNTVPKPSPNGNPNSIAAQYARAKAVHDARELKDREKVAALLNEAGIGSDGAGIGAGGRKKSVVERLGERKAQRWAREWTWVAAFFVWVFFIHASGIYFFTKGFLLTRLVLDEKSTCSEPPIALHNSFKGSGTPEAGCWHPKTFEKAVVIVIDALRYDFTIPFANTSESGPAQAFHNSLPFMYETAVREPHNAFLLPFIADPPTTTLVRIKGLTTGTLPTFVEMGSNFGGEAITEDNLLMQLKDAGRRIVHLGDDTWTALFPGYFEEQISRAYPSFDVWDLHTLDNGVNKNIMPLLGKDKRGDWDVMIAHYLGVDHAGHRYGPNHPAMTAKLQQMDGVLREVVQKLDDDTLLVVMGDHGMDGKGDHGGESDDEVQAALWMYSKKGIFGRMDPSFVTPPKNAKIRPVNQIDLVPTLALLLGLPIPFNNLGKPIEEAFAGKKGKAWENLAAVARMTAAGIKRYQTAYWTARGIDENTLDGSPRALWEAAETALAGTGKQHMWKEGYTTFSAFQEETLRICRSLWARFDVPSMGLGGAILAAGVLALILFANSNANDGDAVDDPELDRKELQLELEQFDKDSEFKGGDETTSRTLVRGALLGTFLGAAGGPAIFFSVKPDSLLNFILGLCTISGLVGVLYQEMRRRMAFVSPFPTTFWGWLAVVFTVSQSIGFASNSYTIWEDSILLFFISTFGVAAAVSSLRLASVPDRTLAVYHSVLFVALGWVASFSKLCREEQMPYCRSTYYASTTSSTSAPWQLAIPFLIAIILPSIIKSYYTGSRSFEGFAPAWISCVFRGLLIFSALFWTLDTADDGEWFSSFIPEGRLKAIRVPIAQTIFAIALGVGCPAFVYAPPCVSISTTAKPSSPNAQMTNSSGATVTILGFANTHGTRYGLLLINFLLVLLLVQKPMGAGALSLMAWQILSLVEILDLNALTTSPIGPIMLALLGSFHFFKTGHQATLSSIQWESAFIPMHSITYPYSPILVGLNTFGAQILAAIALPLVVLWKQKPRKKGLLRSVAAALAWHLAYYAVIGLATTMWAGHLRRHLMLYRIFSPKFMSAAFILLIVDVVGVLVALVGVRVNTLGVAEVFGWP